MSAKNQKEKTKRGKLYYSFPTMSMLPLLFYSVIVIIFSSITFTRSMQEQVFTELQNVANLASTLIDTAYPGDYSLTGDVALSLYKGESNITGDYDLIDTIKERTGVDVTLFYQDTRILTTIKYWDGQRIIGTRAPELVLEEVLEQGQARFYNKTIINGSTYFAYYTPLYNTGGKITGILFVGKPADQVNEQVKRAMVPIFIVGLLALLFSCLFSVRYARTFMKALYALKSFFSKVATGSLSVRLDPIVLKREDELSEIGLSALTMQHSLRSLVEQDTLTELYNRRSGELHLNASLARARDMNTPLTLVIGDIDLFKNVNDTYGHQCGDQVLKNIAGILRKNMRGRGYAIRWGGEEFLLIYENSSPEETCKALSALLDEVRSTCHESEEHQIYVTMTFGIACDPAKDLKDLLHEADDKLYYGKNNGRNRIVTELPSESR